MKPLWTLFRRTKRIGHEKEELLSVYRDFGVIPKASRDDNFNKPSDDLASYQLVKPGDLVINKMKAWQGSLGISGQRGIVSPAYFVYESNHDQVPRYLHYLFRSVQYITGYLSISKGIRVNQWDLDPQYHSRMPVLIPPLEHQFAVSAFLDRETGKIDVLVDEQEKLIALLKEKRQAVISHAVTKGLDSNAPLKDSGIQWLGEIPDHWCLKRIGHFATSIGGGTPSRDKLEFWGGDIPWITPKDMKVEFLNESEETINELGVDNSTASVIGPNQVLIVMRSGILKRYIPVGINLVHTTVNQDMKALDVSREMIPAFFMRFVQGLNRELLLEWSKQGATVESLEYGLMWHTWVPIPPLKEQEEIIDFLKIKTAQIDSLIAEAERAIELLNERRTALISAAVTGKIDVRALVEEVTE